MTTELEQRLRQLITPTEAASRQGMSLQLFKYYLAKPGAPKPLLVGANEDKYFWPDEVAGWNPRIKQEG